MLLVSILLMFSFAAIYSIDLSRGENLIYFPTQFAAFIIGFVLLVVVSQLHMSFFQSVSKPVYVFSVLLLILVLFFGDLSRGTMGWFKFGTLSFQPTELAKIGLIVMLGYLIVRQGRRFDKLQFVVLSGIFLLVPALLILLQPDLGSALVFGGIWFGMLILTGVKKRYIFALLVLLSLGFFLSWHYVLEPYQKERLSVFISPEKDLLDSGYNVNQSVIAIGAGNFFGRGLGFGSQSQLHFLPEAQTDFIFSVIAEEMGFVGAFIVLTVFLLFLVKIISIAKDCRDDYGSYVAVGIGLMFFIQLAFNVGGATGILPITGLTLPFVSYGGSSLVINLFLVGILMSISRSNWENQKENVIYG
ncbi:MAG: rod shape-determining protein RodA [Candidatus Magasanikbacteria bacterium RIFOXYC2_FULL_40_16]|uniref:Rod shape-determining protein RodA n=2 Tax=Candidatus Magasanikiibacteriota TaxID=1752731 RepID=A0A1F6NFJ3_9BACT|nr:MAG: rod shape-determining protein RodA [Candidatus Magasanikbacteria bacterium RIFOXYA2_FULL_40_20]OGH82599.1 MAG: rod shape-determining protein RodA [Candidatus Magasanikbacteria bacterium RIFOXYB1_FULL_40_15]OGH86938.1 MAG: rod shape-determining protein RodA [Candidatus Magasanikbacteria bacterium RIFOXYB2_FULL_40_13]OGH89997.1 MAG: rod shape-determining protein RodA [Candidatus Magasanikbacteria bacterium RIFOXYC2_FULL_40_16]